MTGKTDMVPVLNLPSHLSQPSQSENVPIFDSGTRCRFVPENHDFGGKSEVEKGISQIRRASRPLPAVLPPVGRCVASQGGGRVRIPPGPFGRVLECIILSVNDTYMDAQEVMHMTDYGSRISPLGK